MSSKSGMGGFNNPNTGHNLGSMGNTQMMTVNTAIHNIQNTVPEFLNDDIGKLSKESVDNGSNRISSFSIVKLPNNKIIQGINLGSLEATLESKLSDDGLLVVSGEKKLGSEIKSEMESDVRGSEAREEFDTFDVISPQFSKKKEGNDITSVNMTFGIGEFKFKLSENKVG